MTSASQHVVCVDDAVGERSVRLLNLVPARSPQGPPTLVLTGKSSCRGTGKGSCRCTGGRRWWLTCGS